MRVQKMNERGFSLIEVLVASVMLAIAVMGLAVIIPANNRQVTNTSNISEATALAEQYMTSIKYLWSTAPSYTGNANLTGYAVFNPVNGVVDDRIHTSALHPGQIFYYNPKYVFYVQIWDPKSAMPQAALPVSTLTKRVRVTFYLGNGNSTNPAIKAGGTSPLASLSTDVAIPSK